MNIHYEYICYVATVAILHFDGQIFIALLYENLGHSLSDARIVLFLWDVEIEGVKDLEKGSVEFQQIQFNDRDGLLPLIVNTGCVIGLLRNKYRIIQGTLPISLIKRLSDSTPTIDKILFVCAGLTNLSKSIV